MKICFICNDYPEGPHGGVGTFTRELARRLVIMGHKVKVTGVYFRTYPSPDFETDQGVEVYRIRKGDGKFDWIFAWIHQYKIVKGWVKKGEVEIIEAPDSSGWFAFWGKMNVPLILRSNGSNSYFSHIYKRKPNRLTYWLEKLAYERADFYLAVSKFTAEETKKVFNLKKEIKIIYNAIKLPEISNDIPREKNMAVFSGTLTEKKGVIELIDAINILGNRNVDFEFYLFGKDSTDPQRGPMQKFLEDRIDKKNRSKVYFMGNVPRSTLFEFYQRATVAVFPSFMEAFALAPIESMASGCPTINSNQTSGPELLEDGISGLLVNPYDPVEIADALEKILTNPQLAESISRNGLKQATEFSSEKMEKETIEFYRKCIDEFSKNDRRH